MNKTTAAIIFLTIAISWCFPAQGDPVPLFLIFSDTTSGQIQIQGEYFGQKVNFSQEEIEKMDGAVHRGCVLLADSPILEECGHLETFPIMQWNNYDIFFQDLKKIPENDDAWFIFVFDAEGNGSLPIGPLVVSEGRLEWEYLVLGLEKKTFELREGVQVEILKPYGPVPGIGSQPVQGKVTQPVLE